MINEEVRATIEAELQSGEVLLWADKPQKFPITRHGVCRGIFHILFGAYIVFLFGISLWRIVKLEGVKTELLSFLVVCFVYCLFLLFVWFMRHQPMKHLFGPVQEIYGLTNKRALIISPYWRLEKVSVQPKEMNDIRILGDADIIAKGGIGTIQFDQLTAKFYGHRSSENYWRALDLWQKSDLASFHKIPNPSKVLGLIRETFEKPVS